MLESLHIENIAVIAKVDIDFRDGFTVLTGETGAGKSVIIDSIGLLHGQKADKDMIRTGEDKLLVSGVFSDISEKSRLAIEDAGVTPDEDGLVLVQRTVCADGKSIVKINGRTVTLSVLKAVTPHLITIHGQSETHSLTESGAHLAVLDTYAHDAELVKEYRGLYSGYESIKRQLKELTESERSRERLVEVLEYQIKDIESAHLKAGEENELIDKKLKLKSSEKIQKNTSFVYKALRGSEKGSVAFLLDRSIAALSQLTDVIPECEEYATRLRDCLYQIEDVAEEALAISEEIGDGVEDINDIEERLEKIAKTKRKYGTTEEEVLKFLEKIKSEYDNLTNADGRIKELSAKMKEAYSAALAVGEKLHAVRVGAAKKLEENVKDTLKFLDMPKVVFFADIKEQFEAGKKVLLPTGTDNVEFFISANSGADPQPMSKIASGGELARIMLALKCALSDKDGIPTLIFDEIDAGVSGKTARKIGIKMLDLSASSQVLCVTHSAQIASLADTHYLISKSDETGSTKTKVRELDEEGRIAEISRILGGISVTEAQRNAAVDMLREREQYKH